MTADVPVVPNEKQCLGKPCRHHPELRGLRYKPPIGKQTGRCVECLRIKSQVYRSRPEVRKHIREYHRQPRVRERLRNQARERRSRGKYAGSICEKHPELNGLRYGNGECVRCKYDANKTPKRQRYNDKYRKATFRSGSGLPKETPYASGTVGAAGELLVAHELLHNNIVAYRSLSPHGAHDLVADIDGCLRSIQVKMARLNTKTGNLVIGQRKNITSDLIAFVDLVGRRIRWISNTSEPLPAVLQSRDNPSAIEKDRD